VNGVSAIRLRAHIGDYFDFVLCEQVSECLERFIRVTNAVDDPLWLRAHATLFYN
jgi:hypothetical protein